MEDVKGLPVLRSAYQNAPQPELLSAMNMLIKGTASTANRATKTKIYTCDGVRLI